MGTSVEPAQILSDIEFSYVKSMALNTAVKLNIADIIAGAGEDATLSAEEIAAKLPTSKPCVINLKRVLRLLVLYDIFRAEQPAGDGSTSEVRYGLTPLSQLLVTSAPGSFAPGFRFLLHKFSLTPWLFLDESVLDDGAEPFSAANEGKNIWAVSQEDDKYAHILNQAMASFSSRLLDVALPAYQGFKDAGTVVDVGGGIGKCLQKIIQYNPHIKGINFDLPSVVATAPQIPGVIHVGGDMFKIVPEADVIFMKWILHDWNDEQCIQILQNCWASVPEKGGKVVVTEIVVPPPDHKDLDELRAAAEHDLLMLAHTCGKERTAAEWRALFSTAGFSELNFVGPFPRGQCIIEAYR